MNCPRCGAAYGPGVRFCPNCGAPAGVPVSAPAGVPRPAAAPFVPQKTNVLPWVIGFALAALLAVVGLTASGVLRLGGRNSTNALRMAGNNNGRLLSMGGAPPPSLLADPAKGGPQMPQDVLDWLKHLEKIEKMKQALTTKENELVTAMIPQLQSLGGVSTPEEVNKLSDPDSDISKAPGSESITELTSNFKKDWADLKAKFDGYPPPQECAPIAEAYDNALTGMNDTMDQVAGLVNGIDVTSSSLKSDIGSTQDKLHGISKDHRQNVDGEFAKTDELIQQVCDKYETRKWFAIDIHGGGGGSLGLSGLAP